MAHLVVEDEDSVVGLEGGRDHRVHHGGLRPIPVLGLVELARPGSLCPVATAGRREGGWGGIFVWVGLDELKGARERPPLPP